MDVNETLCELREISGRILYGVVEHPGDAYRLSELFDALDDWIIDGGFIPVDWTVAYQ